MSTKRLSVKNVVILFQFNDGNQLFKNSFSLKTDSIEVVVQKLLKSGVRQKNESKFIE